MPHPTSLFSKVYKSPPALFPFHRLAVTTLLTCLAGFSQPALAVEQESTKKTVQLPEVRVLDEKQKKPLQGIARPLEEHPGSATVVSGEQLEKARLIATTDALRTVPGVNVITEFGRGLRPNIGIRGLNPERSRNILLLTDGIPIQPAVYGDPSAYFNVPVELVDQIEVIKGGTSVLFGPNTVGGVVNYITKRPPEKRQFRLSETVRQGGFFTTFGSYGDTADNGVGVLLSYLNKSGQTVRDHTGTSANDANLKLIVPTGTGELAMRFNYYREESETPGGLSVAQFLHDPNHSQRTHDKFFGSRGSFDLNYQQPLGKDWKLELTSYMNYFQRDWFIADGADPTNPTTNTQFLRQFFVIGVEPKIRWKYFVAGVRLHHEQLKDVRRLGTGADARSGLTDREADLETEAASGYFEGQVPLWEGFTLTPGVRHEAISQERLVGLMGGVGNGQGDLTTNKTLWGVGGLQKFNEMFTGYFNVHKAFQPLTFAEAVDPTTGTANNLSPETSMNYEVGLRVNLQQYGIRGEMGWFRFDFDNQVVSQAGALINAGATRHQGFEAALAYSPLPGLTFDGNVTLLDTSSQSGAFQGNELPMAPDQLYNWGVEYRRGIGTAGKAGIRMEGRFVDDQWTDLANTVAETADGSNGLLPSYSVWNLKLDYGTEDFTVFAGVNNLFDKEYRERRQAFFNGIIPGLTRNFFIGGEFRY